VALLAALERHRWNLTVTGEALRLGSAANVLRAIRALDLGAEYGAAKATGKVGPGNRRPATSG